MGKTFDGFLGIGLSDLLRRDGIGLRSEPTIAQSFTNALREPSLGILSAQSPVPTLGGGLSELLRAPQPAPALKPNSAILDAVEKYVLWERATKIHGADPAVWRQDRFGWWIRFDQYGELSDFGWEKDHLVPSALGGADTPSNYAATHWHNNRKKGARFIG